MTVDDLKEYTRETLVSMRSIAVAMGREVTNVEGVLYLAEAIKEIDRRLDGVEMMIPRGAGVQIDVATDSVTTLTFTIYAGSLRVEHDGDLAARGSL